MHLQVLNNLKHFIWSKFISSQISFFFLLKPPFLLPESGMWKTLSHFPFLFFFIWFTPERQENAFKTGRRPFGKPTGGWRPASSVPSLVSGRLGRRFPEFPGFGRKLRKMKPAFPSVCGESVERWFGEWNLLRVWSEEFTVNSLCASRVGTHLGVYADGLPGARGRAWRARCGYVTPAQRRLKRRTADLHAVRRRPHHEVGGRHHGGHTKAQFGGILSALLLHAASQQGVLGDGGWREQYVRQRHGGGCWLTGWDEEVQAVKSWRKQATLWDMGAGWDIQPFHPM